MSGNGRALLMMAGRTVRLQLKVEETKRSSAKHNTCCCLSMWVFFNIYIFLIVYEAHSVRPLRYMLNYVEKKNAA